MPVQNVAMLISVVIPAFNEEGYLGETLARLNRAKAFLQGEGGLPAEIIVVDNDSDDSTADVARALGATVARERQHNVAKVRNSGAKLSHGDVLVFVDADTIVPDKLLSRIVEVMSDTTCFWWSGRSRLPADKANGKGLPAILASHRQVNGNGAGCDSVLPTGSVLCVERLR
jgi:glycosyltransferase involved in cell wall biosynthesis